MRPLVLVLLTVLLSVVGTVPNAEVSAGAEPGTVPVPVQVFAEAEGARARESVQLVLSLARADDGAPLGGEQLVVRRWDGSSWSEVSTATTDAGGRVGVDVVVRREPERNRFRVEYAGRTTAEGAVYGPGSAEYVVPLVRRDVTAKLRAPRKVVDERRVVLRVRLRADDGTGVATRLTLRKRVKRAKGWGPWRTARVFSTGPRGNARVKVRPRRTTRWRVVAHRTAWTTGRRSAVHRVRNVPPAPRVRLPRGAPRPRITLPKQRRAVGKGANVVVRRIDDRTWRSMVGRSWHVGCPVGRNRLRLVVVNYFDFDGYRRRGEMVVAAGATANFAGAFRALYRARIPVRSMYRVDRFGWSRTLGGADDYRSMAAGNTSVFNCRGVVGNPRVRSPHSYGRSLDLNPWENPYLSRHGWTPNRWWASRSHRRVSWTSANHRVVRILRAHGFRWTYGRGDQHHFGAVGGGAAGSLLGPELCGGYICH